MSDVIKFSEEEMQEIAGLQAKYQQKIFELGQLQLQEIDLEQTKKAFAEKKTELLDSWKTIQKEEETVLNKLGQVW